MKYLFPNSILLWQVNNCLNVFICQTRHSHFVILFGYVIGFNNCRKHREAIGSVQASVVVYSVNASQLLKEKTTNYAVNNNLSKLIMKPNDFPCQRETKLHLKFSREALTITVLLKLIKCPLGNNLWIVTQSFTTIFKIVLALWMVSFS